MALRDQIAAAATVQEQRRIKAQAHAALPSIAGRTIQYAPGEVLVGVSGPTFGLAPDGVTPVIWMAVRYLRNGVDITPAGWEDWWVQAPPVVTPDPAGEIVRTWVDDDGVTHTDRFTENVAKASLAILRSKAQLVFGHA